VKALVDEKIAFAAKHIRNKEGVRWSIKGREWIRDEFWLPADGWKLWRYDDTEPCETCADRIGEIMSHPADNPTAGCKCGGLCAEPILVTILDLERGDGKTFNVMAYSMATGFKARNKSMIALWSSEDQGKRIFAENWKAAIDQAPALSNPRRSKIHGDPPRLEFLPTRSSFQVLSASHRSGTGGRNTHIIVDEARDVPARTVIALLPSINAMHGIECPAGHVQLTPEDVADMRQVPDKCSACGRRLTEWWPRVIIASAAGVLSGNESDWLCELEEKLEAEPHKNYHLFSSKKWGKPLNPRKSQRVTDAVTEVFGVLPSTRHYVAAEYGNQWTQPGEDVMGPDDIKRIMDGSLTNLETSAPTIGMLDTSDKVEKTSLVLLSDDVERSTFPWEHVYMSWLEFWWPGHGKCRKWRRIKEAVVKEAMETVLPLFPGLVRFVIDTKIGAKKEAKEAWPVIMLRQLKTEGRESWRKKLEPYRGTADDSDMGWDFLTARVLDQTLRLQKEKAIIEEIKGVMVLRPKQSDKPAKVVDRNRRVMHKDITQTLADLCWLIKREQLRGRRARVTKESAARRSVTSALRGGTPGVRLRSRIDPSQW
jgi:hypothetical protein